MRKRRSVVGFVLLISWLAMLFSPRPATAQLDPTLRESVIPAAVQVALTVIINDDGDEFRLPFSLGSGTIISDDGLVLTNQHVIDPEEQETTVTQFEALLQAEYPNLTMRVERGAYTLLSPDGNSSPEPLFEAQVIAADADLDLAVLRILRFANGDPLTGPLPFLPLGDSDAVQLGDPIQIFSYPGIGGDSLTYTTGVVSGFLFDDDSGAREAITTDTVISGGSSGGTAVNPAGELIGIPAAGTELDCRPGDTNRDGVTDDQDVGCIPTGGSIGRLVPANVAAAFVAENVDAGAPSPRDLTPEPTPESSSTTGSVSDAMATAAASARQSQPEPTPTPEALEPEETTSSSETTDAEVDSTIYVTSFGFNFGWDDIEEPNRRAVVENRNFVVSLSEPGRFWTFGESAIASTGEAVRFSAELTSTDGPGQLIIAAITASGEEWFFGIDPTTQQWSLYRDSAGTEDLFTWVEPVSYAGVTSGPVERIGVEIRNGQAVVLVNDVDISSSTGIPLPEFSGPITFRFGVAAAPAGSAGEGQAINASFNRVELVRLD